MDRLFYEKELLLPGIEAVIGIDEAGRGPLAGPVFAAAVSVPLEEAQRLVLEDWAGVDDSKKLSPKKRDALAAAIKKTSCCRWAVESASPREIDRINILKATHLAMARCASSLLEKMGLPPEKAAILVDGLAVPSLPCRSKNIVKGDSKSLLVAAASILAKTARDEYCLRLDSLYPGYGFGKHKGYPTKAHLDALRRLGATPEHRFSFSPVSERDLFLDGGMA